MSPRFYQYRIVYKTGSQTHEWTRSGTSKARVEDLAKRALRLLYGPNATLVSVELVVPDR